MAQRRDAVTGRFISDDDHKEWLSLMKQTTGMSEKQLKIAVEEKRKKSQKDRKLEDHQKKLLRELQSLQKQNETAERELKRLGQDTKDNKKFRKTQAAVDKKQLQIDKVQNKRDILAGKNAAKVTAGEAEDKKKEGFFKRKTLGLFKGIKNTGQEQLKRMSSFGKKGLMGALTVVGLLALVKFLESDTWTKIKEKIAEFDFQALYDQFFGEKGVFPKIWNYFFEKEKGLFPRLSAAFTVFKEEGFVAGIKNLWTDFGGIEKIIAGIALALVIPTGLTVVAFTATAKGLWSAMKGIKNLMSGWGKGAGAIVADPAFRPPGGKPGGGKGRWFKGVGKKFLRVLKMFAGKKGIIIGLVAGATALVTMLMGKTADAAEKVKKLGGKPKAQMRAGEFDSAASSDQHKQSVREAEKQRKIKEQRAKVAEQKRIKAEKDLKLKQQRAEKLRLKMEQKRLGMSRGGGNRGYSKAVTKFTEAQARAAAAAEAAAAKKAAAKAAEQARRAAAAEAEKVAKAAREAKLLKSSRGGSYAGLKPGDMMKSPKPTIRGGSTNVVKTTGKSAVKTVAKIGAKTAGKVIARSMPFVGLGMGMYFAASKAWAGDWIGAGMELAAGGAAMFPGPGTAISLGITAGIMAREMGAFDEKGKGIANQIAQTKKKIKLQKGMIKQGETTLGSQYYNKSTQKARDLNHLAKLQSELSGLEGQQAEIMKQKAGRKAELESQKNVILDTERPTEGVTMNNISNSGDSFHASGAGSVVDGDAALARHGNLAGYDAWP